MTRKMKVLLIVPPYRTTDALVGQLYPQPLGPVWVATVLNARGHTCVVKDFLAVGEHIQKSSTPTPLSFVGKHAPPYLHYGTPMSEVLDWLDDNVRQYDAVGLSCCQCNLWETVELIARRVKQLGRPLVGGGPFVTTATEEAFARFGLDVAVQYEGEWVAEEAFERAVAGERGVVLNGGDGERDITELPLPDWSLSPPSQYPRYGGHVRGVLTISRGCPWTCEFCSVFTIMSRRHRRQSKERIKEELKNLWRHGVRYFCFLDDNLVINEKAADQLLSAISELDAELPGFKRCKFYIEEGIEVRVAAMPGIIERLAAGGRWENLALGLETANAAAAKEARKPYTAEQLRQAVTNCQASGVTTKAFYIIGFPNDTIDSVAADLVEFAKFRMAARPNNLKLYPGTGTTSRFLSAGLVDDGYDWRLSTFYTPNTKHLKYPEIRKLKTILGAIGFAADAFGIDPFADSLEIIEQRLRDKKYDIQWTSGGLTLSGNMFRTTPYRVLAEIVCARKHNSAGAISVDGSNQVIATASKKPKDIYQAAIFAAMRGVKREIVRLGFGF